MKFLFGILLGLSFSNIANSQISIKQSVFARQWSKDITLDMAKIFIVQNLVSVGIVEERLVCEGISAANSGELTAVCFSGDSAKTVGLVLAFYGNYWNDEGVTHKGYAFKSFDGQKASEFLSKIISVYDKNVTFLEKNYNINNMVFSYDDISLIMYANSITKIRLLWQGFDSEWNIEEVKKIYKRFETFK